MSLQTQVSNLLNRLTPPHLQVPDSKNKPLNKDLWASFPSLARTVGAEQSVTSRRDTSGPWRGVASIARRRVIFRSVTDRGGLDGGLKKLESI